MPASAAPAPAHQQTQRAHLSEDGCVTGKGVLDVCFVNPLPVGLSHINV